MPNRRKKAVPPRRSTPSAAEGTAPRTDEYDLARQVQRAMVPSVLPAVEGLECSSFYRPCDALGGDLYDMIRLSDDLLAVYMFDVSGHGVASALLSAMAKSCFTNHLGLRESPRIVMQKVNDEMRLNISTPFYLTAFVAYFDLHDNRLSFCNAGHPYPMLFRARDRTVTSLTTPGFIIGIFEKGYYEEEHVFLGAGDVLMIFTDGIYGLFSETNELVSRSLMEKEFLATAMKGGAGALADVVRSRRETGAARDFEADDVSFLCFEVQSLSRKILLKRELGFSETDPVYLQYLSYYEEMDRAVGVILRNMDVFGYSNDFIRKMKIVLVELLANAISHGNNEDHAKRVLMGHVVDRMRTRVSVMDEGPGFNYEDIPDPTLPENMIKNHGRGLYIVRSYVDSMEFNERGNRILITKQHSSPGV